jgi:hypothetical protein
MAPRVVLAALSIAFGIALVGATVTTVRQLRLHGIPQTESHAETRTNHLSLKNETL